MWLKASKSNKDPRIVCKYFAECGKELGGLPCLIRADRGTENCNVESMQTTLRNQHADHRGRYNASFLNGTSPSNQRIEGWWSKFQAMGMHVWIDHMKLLEEHGIIDLTQKSHVECIRFCYMGLLQKELDTIRLLWNTHRIRLSRNPFSPAGKPDVMFHMPEVYEVTDHLKPVDEDDIDALSSILCCDTLECCPTHKEAFQLIAEAEQLHFPTNLEESEEYLVTILDKFEGEYQNL